MTLTLALARLAWKRLWRGKMVWISGLLVLVPLSIAAIAPRDRSPERRFELIVELTLRSLVLLVPVLHLAPVVGEESERKTYTYLWSRPVPRPTLLWGNLLVILPLAAVAAAATLAAAFALIGGEVEWLARAQAGAAAGVAGASAFALGVGALFPRHPLVVTLAWVFLGEQILPEIPSVQNLSIVRHATTIAGHGGDDPAGAALAVAILSAIWLAVAVWRIKRMEFGSAEG
ncbi:MAG TPA: ABC transporter permease subunit [Haliangiales bacterium]|nr:ABC transporter permease subunit [Haliangiales bacterium]